MPIKTNPAIGLVLAGAVARGAYEAGAVSVMLPALEARGERPDVLVGTSSGALNAAFLASRADRGAEEATAELLEIWRTIETKDVFRLSPRTFGRLFRRGRGGLLDTAPLRRTIDAGIGDWDRIRRNLVGRQLRTLAVVTTATSTGRTTVFVEDAKPKGAAPYLRDNRKGIDYVRPVGGIGIDHVLASAAVPVLFPAQRIGSDWHVDGGMRLNTPIKPAIQLGVERVLIVATDPARWPEQEAGARRTQPPDFDDAALQFLQAALVDPLVEDMWRLAEVNTLLAARPAARKRPIGYLFVGPDHQGALGGEAEAVPLRGIRARGLSALLGRQGEQSKELLSYMLFEHGFIERAIRLGQADARREVRASNRLQGGWRMKRLPEVRRRTA